MSIIDKIGEAIFDAQWYIFEERPIRKSMRRFNRDMDKAIGTLNKAIEKYPEEEPIKEDDTAEICEQAQKFRRRRFI